MTVTVPTTVIGEPERAALLGDAGAGLRLGLDPEPGVVWTAELGGAGATELLKGSGTLEGVPVEEDMADDEAAPAPELEQESAVSSTLLHMVTEVLLVV